MVVSYDKNWTFDTYTQAKLRSQGNIKLAREEKN